MALCSETLRKKQKTERDVDVFTTFHDVYLSKHPSFINALSRFKQEITALAAYEIGSCNAADPDNGYSFTKADCTLRSTKNTFAFANFFVDAFNMLNNFVVRKEIPSDSQMKLALERLIGYLMNEEIQEALSQTKECSDEAEWTVLLAFHLFSQLSPSPYFIIDNRKPNQPKVCPCRKRHGKVIYEDTSIGNVDAWHGYLDLIMEGSDVVVDTLDGDSEIFNDEETAVEVKQKHFDMTDNSAGSSLVQLAAKTIVYSCYYKQIHPDHRNSLIPSIGVSDTGLIFYFYDSVNDVLLGSTHFPLASSNPFELNLTAVIALWFVLNHKYLCNGFSYTEMKEVPKANFVDAAKSKLDIYKKELKRGQVRTGRGNTASLDPLLVVNPKFTLVPELE